MSRETRRSHGRRRLTAAVSVLIAGITVLGTAHSGEAQVDGPRVPEADVLIEGLRMFPKRLDDGWTVLSANGLVAVDIVRGANRGTVTYHLYRGRVRGRAHPAFFIVSEASDFDFARTFGAPHVPRLRTVEAAAIERGPEVRGDQWEFEHDPGRLAQPADDGSLRGAITNPQYSPIKAVRWNGKPLVAHLPFIRWGEHPSEGLGVDTGGCSPAIGKNLPGTAAVGGGPPGCEGDGGNPLRRYLGGQVVALDIPDRCHRADAPNPCGSVTMKAHRTLHRTDVFSYTVVSAATQQAAAEQLGVPNVPKLRAVSTTPTAPVAVINHFYSGVPVSDGGPARFQPSIASFGSYLWSTYSPLAQVRAVVVNCSGRGEFFDKAQNQSFASAPRIQAGVPASIDPFPMPDKGAACPGMLAELTPSGSGILQHRDLQRLFEAGKLIFTEFPVGWTGTPVAELGLGGPLVIAASAPVTFQLKPR